MGVGEGKKGDTLGGPAVGTRRVGARRVGKSKGAQRQIPLLDQTTDPTCAPKGGDPNAASSRVVAADCWARRVQAQNFALSFPLPPQFSFFLPLLGGGFVEFWWCY